MKKMNVRYGIQLNRFKRELREAEDEGKNIRSLKPRAMKLWLEAHRLNRRLPDDVMAIFVAAIEDKVTSHEKRVRTQREKRDVNKGANRKWTNREGRDLFSIINNHIQEQKNSNPHEKESLQVAIFAYIDSEKEAGRGDITFNSVAAEYRRRYDENQQKYEEIENNRDYVVLTPKDYETMFNLPNLKKDIE